jgi:ankyrin repeat protein
MRAKLIKENIDDLLVPKSKEDIIKELSNLRQEEKNEKLIDAVYDGQLEIVKYLIEAGANINDQNKFNYTPLMIASINNRLNMVKLLIENGADVNAKNKYGKTAFIYAYNSRYYNLVELLKKHGAKI